MKLNWRRLCAIAVTAVATIIAHATTALANAPNTANAQNDPLVGQSTGELETVVELNTGMLEGGALMGAELATANNATVNTSPNATPSMANVNNNGAPSIWTAINNTTKVTCEAIHSSPALAMKSATTARNGPMTTATTNTANNKTCVAALTTEGGNRYGAELATTIPPAAFNEVYQS